MQSTCPNPDTAGIRQSSVRSAASPSILRRLAAFALVFLLLLMTQADLCAQQAPYYPGPQQPYPSGNQYDSGQQYPMQSDYDQPAYDQPAYNQQQPGYAQSPALGPDQLEQLVAPIALNPDPLVALMLAASTYPQQVQQSDQWRQAQGNASPSQIDYGANLQPWDPSVKALTAFPQVLAEMDQNIQWTAALGNAYYNQPQDVLQAIQIMRQRAQSAGNLVSTPQQAVSYDQGYIQLMPVNPQVIYVPAYDPWTVYGDPVTPYPGFSLLGAIGSFFSSGFGSSAVRFGLGTVLSAFSHSPWGLLAWGLDWIAQHLLFNNSDYYSGSTSVADWGLPYGGPRARMAAPWRALVAYNRGYGQRYGQGYGQRYGQGYNSNYNRGSSDLRYAYMNDRLHNNYNNRSYQASGYNYNRGSYASSFASGNRNGIYNRPQSPFAGRTAYNGNRSLQAYNRYPQSNMRPAYQDRYSPRSSYGSAFVGREQSPFAARSGYASTNYGSAYGSWRGPSSGFNTRSGSFAGPSSRSSGGFHFFGNGHSNNSALGRESGFRSESFRAPKYKAPKEPKFREPSYRAPKAPKMHFSSGGSHHSGGSGHSGGHHR